MTVNRGLFRYADVLWRMEVPLGMEMRGHACQSDTLEAQDCVSIARRSGRTTAVSSYVTENLNFGRDLRECSSAMCSPEAAFVIQLWRAMPLHVIVGSEDEARDVCEGARAGDRHNFRFQFPGIDDDRYLQREQGQCLCPLLQSQQSRNEHGFAPPPPQIKRKTD